MRAVINALKKDLSFPIWLLKRRNKSTWTSLWYKKSLSNWNITSTSFSCTTCTFITTILTSFKIFWFSWMFGLYWRGRKLKYIYRFLQVLIGWPFPLKYLHDIFFGYRFLHSLHNSFLNQTTLDLRKEKWTFLNREFTVPLNRPAPKEHLNVTSDF